MANETTFTLNRATVESGLEKRVPSLSTMMDEPIFSTRVSEREAQVPARDRQVLERAAQVLERDLRVLERDTQVLAHNSPVPKFDALVLEGDPCVLEPEMHVLERNVLECNPQVLDHLADIQRDAQVCELVSQLRVLQENNKILEERGKKLAQELDIFRHRRLVYWSDRFRNRFDAWHLMHPGFEQAKDDTMLFQGDLKDFRLLPSSNLVRLSSLKYEIDLGRAGLRAILLAPIIDMPSQVGELCMRIIDSNQKVFEEVSIPVAKLTEEEPCEFRFSSLEGISRNRLCVHIFTQGIDVPVRIFELRKYPRFGFAKLQRKLFAGFRFSD